MLFAGFHKNGSYFSIKLNFHEYCNYFLISMIIIFKLLCFFRFFDHIRSILIGFKYREYHIKQIKVTNWYSREIKSTKLTSSSIDLKCCLRKQYYIIFTPVGWTYPPFLIIFELFYPLGTFYNTDFIKCIFHHLFLNCLSL